MLKIFALLLVIVRLPVVPNSIALVAELLELNVPAVAVLSFRSKVPLAKPNALVEPKVNASIKRTVAPGAATVRGKSSVREAEVIVCVPLVAAKVVTLVPAVNDMVLESVKFPYMVLALMANAPVAVPKFKFLILPVTAKEALVFVPVMLKLIELASVTAAATIPILPVVVDIFITGVPVTVIVVEPVN